jgi:hypothetical protein
LVAKNTCKILPFQANILQSAKIIEQKRRFCSGNPCYFERRGGRLQFTVNNFMPGEGNRANRRGKGGRGDCNNLHIQIPIGPPSYQQGSGIPFIIKCIDNAAGVIQEFLN